MVTQDGCPICFYEFLYERNCLVQKRFEPSSQFVQCHGECFCILCKLRLHLPQCIAVRH